MVVTDSQKWLILAGTLLVGWVLTLLSPILSPFLTALLLAYMGDPVVKQLQRWKLSRTQSVVVAFLVMTLVVIISALFVVPAIIQQVDQLVALLPELLAWARSTAVPWVEQRLGIELAQFDWLQLSKKLDWGATGNTLKVVLDNVSQSSLAVIALLGNLILIPVVTFYLLRDWDSLIERTGALIPRYYYPVVVTVVKQCHETLGAFFRGQLLVMLSLGVIYALGLMVMGLELGLLIGLLAGLASVVPYLGAIVGIASALIAAYFQFGDVLHLVLVVLVFGVGQTLESVVLTPKFVGDRIGLHPVAVIFAVLAGGQLFGFVGILLALPVAAVLVVLVRLLHERYRGSQLYGPSTEDTPESHQQVDDAANQEESVGLDVEESMRQEDA